MRRAIFSAALLVGFAALTGPALASAYCSGYQDGYRAGFCEGKLVCYGGTPSSCPSAPYDQNNYQAGYNRGYRDGAAAGRRSR